VFIQLSEKQHVVFSNQPVVLLLGVFEKVENYLSLVDLTAKPNNFPLFDEDKYLVACVGLV